MLTQWKHQARQGHTSKQKFTRRNTLTGSGNQEQQSDLWIYGSIRSKQGGGRGGAGMRGSCREGLLADRERLAAAIYGSRNRWIYFCLPVSLENNKRDSQPVRGCVAYQLLCLKGRWSMLIFERRLSNVCRRRWRDPGQQLYELIMQLELNRHERALLFPSLRGSDAN